MLQVLSDNFEFLTILGGNGTVIQSGVTLFKVIAVPTYMFILGVIAGVLAISFVLIWRFVILIQREDRCLHRLTPHDGQLYRTTCCFSCILLGEEG